MKLFLTLLSIGLLSAKQFQKYKTGTDASKKPNKINQQRKPKNYYGWGDEDTYQQMSEMMLLPTDRNCDVFLIANPLFGTDYNPLLNNFYKTLQTVTPIIGCLSIPDIESVKITITNTFTSIYNRITALIRSALLEIRPFIDRYYEIVQPQIPKIVTDSNTAIKDYIKDQFNTIRSRVETCVADATLITVDKTDKNVDSTFPELLEKIMGYITEAEGSVDEIVDANISNVVADVTNALNEANGDEFNQMTGLLTIKDNISPIIPQLTFADPDVISSIVISDSKKLYTDIESLLSNAEYSADKFLKDVSPWALSAGVYIIDGGVYEIVDCMNSNIDAAIANIREYINDITKKEITQITTLIKDSSSELTSDIKMAMAKISPQVEAIISGETASLKSTLKTFIISNNQDLIAQVDTILFWV